MNVRQKLSLAALCLTLPVMASAQEAAPAFSFKPYGFLALTYAQQDGTFKYPEYASVIVSEEGKSAVFSARQSRIGWLMGNADSGYLGAKSLSARLEFDFMGAGASWDSALPRFRYAYAKADWAAGPGTLSLTAGQTDGLVNPLHPELGAHLALPTFMQAGNLTRRSPQLRVGYGFNAGEMVGLTFEAAALSPAGNYTYDTTTKLATNNGMISGMPDLEARAQIVVKPVADVAVTVGAAYHMSKLSYDDDADGKTDEDVDASVLGVDVNADITKYLNVRGEFFTGEGTDATYTGAFAALGVTTAGSREANETSGFWVQATGKPIPQLWIMAGFGSTTQKGVGAADDFTRTMLNVGVLSNVSKNWRLGLEYTGSTADDGTDDISGSEIALSSRFTF